MFVLLIVQRTFVFAYDVLAEAGSSFIHVGTQLATSKPQQHPGGCPAVVHSEDSPWMTFFPGEILFVLVLAINLMGDGFRELLNLRLRRMFKGG